MDDKTTDLGFANGWETTPEIIDKCEKLGHKQWRRSSGRCLTEYGCETCNYTFLVDSSD